MAPTVGKLYIMELSPPCRAVMLTAKALGINLELVETNLFKNEHFNPSFLKLNPNHSTPTFVDNDGTTIGDSHAIMAYLASKFGKDDTLYPKNLAKRSMVDQMLHFDCGTVYSLHKSIVRPMYAKMQTGPTKMQMEAAEKMYTSLNMYLEGNKWVTGSETPTIADFSLITSILCISIVAPFDKQKFPNIVNWIKRCETLPCFEVNHKGQEIYASMLNNMLNNKYEFLVELTK